MLRRWQSCIKMPKALHHVSDMRRTAFLLMACLFSLVLPAQICEGLHVVTLRGGDALTLGLRTTLRAPLSITAEHCLVEEPSGIDGLALGMGLTVGSARTGYGYDAVRTAEGLFEYVQTSGAPYFVEDTRRHLSLGLQGYLHYDVLGQLFGAHNHRIDTYAVLTAGLHSIRQTREVTQTTSVGSSDTPEVIVSHPNRLLLGLQAGCRYWALPNFGLTFEAGYDGLSILNMGINVCF